MATVGQQLTSPEAGWKRIDDTNANISYSTHATASTSAGVRLCYNGTAHTMSGLRTGKALFNFVGTKLRIISYMGDGINDSEFEVLIDGVAHKATTRNSINNYQMLSFEKTGLENKEHVVVVTKVPSGQMVFDAIDIDETGEIKPYNPWLNKTKNNIGSMQIGDRIAFEYTAQTSGAVGSFANLGAATKAEIPTVSSATPDGTAYFIHAGYDLRGRMKLVCDRSIQHSLSWDSINAAGLVDGVEVQIGNKKGIMRLMTGGVASSDTDNEWNQIICNSTLNGTITAGDNAVWNWNGKWSLTSTRYDALNNVIRGYGANNGFSYGLTSAVSANYTCFRPIILLDIQVNNFNLESIEPYHVYPQQHETFIVKLNVTNQETSQPSSFKILKNGVEVSGAGVDSSRTIPVSLLSDGLNTLSIETIDPIENLGTINVFKEQPYRSNAERTFTAKEEGYAAKNVLHSSGSAKRKTAAANQPPLNSGIATAPIDPATNKITVQ